MHPRKFRNLKTFTFLTYPASRNGRIDLTTPLNSEYPFNDSKRGRLLYLVETNDGQIIVAKFVRQYCPELHDIWATSDRAPSLLAYQRLPGGWYSVGMEYVASAVPITLHKKISVHFQRWETDLRQLASQFHGLGFVHGDLRDANIISGGESSWLRLGREGWPAGCRIQRGNLNLDLTKGRSAEDENQRRIICGSLDAGPSEEPSNNPHQRSYFNERIPLLYW